MPNAHSQQNMPLTGNSTTALSAIDIEEVDIQSLDTSSPESMSDTSRNETAAEVRVKRQRIIDSKSQESQQNQSQPIGDLESDGDLFGEDSENIDALFDEDYTTIDLTEATEVPDELKKPEVDNRVKLAAFQCVICMDDVTSLTLTHCGHLFCAQCLHSSLHVETTKGKCPMCRAKIDMKAQRPSTLRSKGFWPLELKLMTSARKGKRKADNMS